MNAVARQMRVCRLAYASIYCHPRQVLEHWFVCIGNGYEWGEDGNLVAHEDPCHLQAARAVDRGHIPPWTKAPAFWNRERDKRSAYNDKYMKAKFKKLGIPWNRKKDPIKDTIYEDLNRFGTWQWGSISDKYSLCMTIPSHAPDCWKRAVIGTMKLIIKEGPDKSRGSYNADMAKKAIERIESFE